MPESPTPSPRQPWEDNWSPDTSHVPGTRRLWLAGALAAATVVACVTAVTVTDRRPDGASPKNGPAITSDGATAPGLISFASPSTTGTDTPDGKSALASAHASGTTSGRSSGTPTSPSPGSPGAASSGAPEPPASSAGLRFVRSVNYPDHYWRVSDDQVSLDTITSSSARRSAGLRLVKGLADSSCHSFVTADGEYLRHRDFVLRADDHDGSRLFQQDATFCPRSLGRSDAVALESVNYPGHFLRHQNFRLRLDSSRDDGQFSADAAFRLVTDVTESDHGRDDDYGDSHGDHGYGNGNDHGYDDPDHGHGYDQGHGYGNGYGYDSGPRH